MAEQGVKDLLLHDPLSNETRQERKMLLGVSMLGIVLVKTGLVPTKLSALGVDFDKANQQALLKILALVTLYFAVAFLIYAAADFLAWRRALSAYRIEKMRERMKLKGTVAESQTMEEERIIMESMRGNRVIFTLAGPVSTLRAIFEFLLPIAVCIYAIQLLWFSVNRI